MAAEVRIPELLQVSHVGTDTHVLGLSSACSDVLAGRWIRSGQLSLEPGAHMGCLQHRLYLL